MLLESLAQAAEVAPEVGCKLQAPQIRVRRLELQAPASRVGHLQRWLPARLWSPGCSAARPAGGGT